MLRILSASLALGILLALTPAPVQASAPARTPHHAHPNVHRGHLARPAAISGNSTPSGYIPCDIVTAYRLSRAPGDGAGLTIAVIDAFHLASATGDYIQFSTTFNVGGTPALEQHPMGNPPTMGKAEAYGWADEIDLDVEWAHAMAPAATIVLVEAVGTNDSDLLAGVDWAVGTRNADIVSMSWSIDEAPGTGTALTLQDVTEHDTHFPATNASGKPVAYLAATGDRPAAATVGWPADSTRVIAVGGTTLAPSAAGEGTGSHTDCMQAVSPQGANQQNETAWGSAISGPSAIVPAPAFQAISGDARRVVPDVSMMGDPGFAVYSGPAGATNPWVLLTGDSGATAIMAGVLARLNTGRAPVTQPLDLYQVATPTGLNDVISGSSAGSGGTPYMAGPNFDKATGLGSPKATALFPRGHMTPMANPVRLLDTRAGDYHTPANGPQYMLQAGVPIELALPPPPSPSSAVVLNVTATDASQGGFVAAFAGGTAWPKNSNLNFGPGQASTNLVQVPIGTDGKVSFISSLAVDLIVDLFGWVTDSTADPNSSGRLVPVTPKRIVDTRGGNPWPADSIGIEIKPLVPSTATAVVLNVTAVNAQTDGFLAVFPQQPWPSPHVSNVNYSASQTMPNRVVVGLGTNHSFWVNSAAVTDVLIDISGYYDSSPGAATFTVSQPERLYDSRLGAGRVVAGTPRRVQIGGVNGVPLGIKAVAVNVTVTDVTWVGYFAAYAGSTYPGTSDLNVAPTITSTELVVVPVADDGTVTFAYGSVPGSMANLIVDVTGWFG